MTEKIGKMEDVKNLIGKKATIYIMSEFGFPASHQVTVTEVIIAPYAQYPEALTVMFKKFRQRKNRGFIILPYKDFAIWEGWLDINDEMYIVGKDMTTQKSRLSFDSQYTTDALGSTDQKPVYAQFSFK